MNENDLRKKALLGMAWQIAHDNVGIYAKAVHGEGGYEKRTERMEGWNDCALAHSRKMQTVMEWLRNLPEAHRTTVENWLLDGIFQLYVDKEVTLTVDCSDLFVWGCSDYEPIELEELKDLNRAIEDARAAGAETGGELLWVARKRKLRPQGAYYAHVHPGLGKLFDTCGEFRPAELGNPVASSYEDGEKYRSDLHKKAVEHSE